MSGEQQAEIPPALSEKTRVISFAHVPIQGALFLPTIHAKIRVAALPPDVRMVYDLPMGLNLIWGYAPLSGRSPNNKK
jgi:hypothetical protein